MNKAVDPDLNYDVELDEKENIGSNPTNNRPFYDILRADMERRDVLKGSLAVGATTFFGGALMSSEAEAQTGLMNFTPVTLADAAAGDATQPLVSPDYDMQVLIPWGDPLEPSGPAYAERANTSREQALQIGIGHDGMWFFPLDEDLTAGTADADDERRDLLLRIRNTNRRGMLCINHEFGRNSHVFGKNTPESLEEVRMSQHAHGVSVVYIEQDGRQGMWSTAESKNSRRIHVNTPVEFSGPAADSELLQNPAGNIPLGTVNNCGNSYTPWGTYLTCEENFNGYFGSSDGEAFNDMRTEDQERYGFDYDGFGYGWHLFDKRFDMSDPDFVNERHRFGWMVEIDPQDATRKPVKRTALGRFKHEGGAWRIGSGNRFTIYMGDDERFDYIYKFVSSGDWEQMIANGMSPLDSGTLYVAQFNEGGAGTWLELSLDNPDVSAIFSSMEEVLIYARMAADAAGATPMDRPEWTSTAPDGNIYVTLTNNSRREVADAANPLAPNADGHIIRFLDADPTDTTFTWEIFLIAEDTHGTEESFSDPDGLWVDPDGRVFIETDGGQKDGLQDQLLIADSNTKEIRRLFMGVSGDEITGIATTPNRKTLFINIQHPGNGDPSATNFPAATDGVTIPRDCTIVLNRKDNGIVGS